MAQAETNRVDIRIFEESTWNETPSSPAMASLPYVSESIKYDKRTIKSNTVRADRHTDDIIEVGAGSSGDLNYEYKFGDFEALIEAALGMDFVTATYTGVIGDLDIAASSGGTQVYTAPAATFNSFVVGAYVRVSGSDAANNGVFRITARNSTTMTVNNATGTLEANADGTVLTMKYARTGTNKKSFLIEKSFGDIDKYISHRGMRVSTWSMNCESEQIITGSFGFVGAGAYSADNTISGSVAAQGALSVCGATANVGRIEEAGVALTTKIKAIRFNLNANVRQLTAVGSKFPIGINMGSFEITGSIDAYFEDLALYDKFISHEDSSLVFEIDSLEDDRTIITLNAMKFTDAAPAGTGLNQDAMVTLNFTSKKDSVFSSMMQVDLLT